MSIEVGRSILLIAWMTLRMAGELWVMEKVALSMIPGLILCL